MRQRQLHQRGQCACAGASSRAGAAACAMLGCGCICWQVAWMIMVVTDGWRAGRLQLGWDGLAEGVFVAAMHTWRPRPFFLARRPAVCSCSCVAAFCAFRRLSLRLDDDFWAYGVACVLLRGRGARPAIDQPLLICRCGTLHHVGNPAKGKLHLTSAGDAWHNRGLCWW